MLEDSLEKVCVYVGTYSGLKNVGIYLYLMDPCEGSLEFASEFTGIENPSFLAFGRRRRILYAVSTVDGTDGEPGGTINAFSIDARTGELAFLNRQPSGGGQPCHLSVDRTGQFVLVANYSSGSVSVFPIQEDGGLGSPSDLAQHEGFSVHPERQKGPHAHSVILDPFNRYVYVPDLGIDKIMIYRLDLTRGKLTSNSEPWVRVKAGAGPRHIAFHPTGRYAYLINELDSTLTAFAFDGALGILREIQTVPCLPEGFRGRSTGADVHISPSGKYVYGSNRGHDSIVVYAIDAESGQLSYVGHEPTQGRTPRGFAIDPTGTFLLAANQSSDSIVVFRIDQESGRLVSTGHAVRVPAPACVKIMEQSSYPPSSFPSIGTSGQSPRLTQPRWPKP